MEMANLLVRNLDDALVQNLREQAAAHGRSVEAEHREILAQALFQPRKLSFAELLMSMPDVGDDADFERRNDATDDSGGPGVFD
ncbi:DNA-binding protein [Paraburkholderia caribensis MBA4]|jgi:plasmid stability protein|uniref:DNA-binding protein n=2 Tax=Paraburkholderia caribensis TaxID=75105 RepID=A0A0P0RAM1_9BURK|nr:DNA-binding protein [Paraburkholderia caribensis MBA4]MDR6383339.1 plasmid stability protein [Paraburkholderia caribensis]CAG9239299.1 Putative plasmid stability protein y4jJ [Paraburkholderia caribensis]